MTLDMTAAAADGPFGGNMLHFLAVVFLCFAIIGLVITIGAVFTLNPEAALAACAMSIACALFAGTLADKSHTTPDVMASVSTQMQDHYGVEVPEEELQKYFNGNTEDLHEFEVISDDGKLLQYALKEEGDKVYLFKKTNVEYAEVDAL